MAIQCSANPTTAADLSLDEPERVDMVRHGWETRRDALIDQRSRSPRRCLLVLGPVWLLTATSVHAEPRDAGASSAPRRLELYGESSAWYGAVSGATLELLPTRRTGLASIKDLRVSLGLGVRGRSFAARLGPTIDLFVGEDLDLQVFNGDNYGIAFGLSAQIDWNIDSCWRLGPRLSLSRGEGDGVTTGHGIVAMGGVHIRNDRFVAGIDMLRVWGDDSRGPAESGTGIMAGAGFDGRPGKYSVAVAGAGAAIGGIAALIMMTLANTH